MTEQGNSGGTGGDLSTHMPQQGQGYSLGIRGMDVMDEMVLGGIGNSPQRISDMDSSGDTLDSLVPIFPPQNFEVPDISFSNSVSPNVDFNQSLLSSANMYGNSNTVYTTVNTSSGHLTGAQSIVSHQMQQGHTGISGQQMAISNQQPVTYFPSASRSPPGSSSSDDSDDLPLAQLAKRAVIGNTASHAGTSASVASPLAPSTDTTSMEGSPVSGAASKKAKQTKRKKKKDPNEPQKPVSAYALFFRDTQATIKGHNPSASFGEVSKIVASMWDQLDPEHKDVYKKKTETAKKQYLKQLAAYRASQVSQSASEEAEKSPSPPGKGSLGSVSGTTNFQAMGAGAPQGQVMAQQRLHIQQQSPQHLMQMSPQMMQQQHQQQQMQQQIHQQLLQQQQMNMSQSSPSHQHSPPQEMPAMSGPVYTSPPHVGQTNSSGYQPTMMDHNVFGFTDQDMNMETTYPQCVRSGCRNHARENPAWDSEYCSNDCVITHCRDIFKNWVASRSGSNAYPVK